MTIALALAADASNDDDAAASSSFTSPPPFLFAAATQFASSAVPAGDSLFLSLSEDLLVCVLEHLGVRDLAGVDCTCRAMHSMLSPNKAELSESSAAHYLWRQAAVSAAEWTFPAHLDRESLERSVLRHLAVLPPRTYSLHHAMMPASKSEEQIQAPMLSSARMAEASQKALAAAAAAAATAATAATATPSVGDSRDGFPMSDGSSNRSEEPQQSQPPRQETQQDQVQPRPISSAMQQDQEPLQSTSPATQQVQEQLHPASASIAAAGAASWSASASSIVASTPQPGHQLGSDSLSAASESSPAVAPNAEAVALAQAQAAAHLQLVAEVQALSQVQDVSASSVSAVSSLQAPAGVNMSENASMAISYPGATALPPLSVTVAAAAASPSSSPAPLAASSPPTSASSSRSPLDWKSILASVHRRRASKGTGTVVLDMGSCTVSVGLGGIHAMQAIGAPAAADAAAASPASASDPNENSPSFAGPPSSFPAIALNDLVGDEIGSDSVKLRGINPVSSISMPILHANETGEFGFCSSIWQYALARVPTETFTGKPALSNARENERRSREQQREKRRRAQSDEGAAAASSVDAATSSPSPCSPPAPFPSPSSDVDEMQGGTVLVCDQLLGSRLELAKKRAKVARILFGLLPPSSDASASAGKFKVAFCNESLLSLINAGKTTGIVLHVGFSRSTCSIFVDGRLQNLHALPTRMVGGHVHSRIMLQALFSRRQFQPAVADMFQVIPLLKQACYVSLDSAAELRKPREETHCSLEISGQRLVLGHERFTSSDVFFLYGFPAMVVEALQSSPNWPVLQARTPDAGASGTATSSNATHNDQHSETATASAAMEDAKSTSDFSAPSSAASSAAPSASISDDADALDSDAAPPADDPHALITHLLQSIVLSGRSTTLRGFGARFERDLNSILKPDTPARVHSNPTECTWLGGSLLSSLSGFDQLCMTREEFEQDGINAIFRHMEI